MAIIITDDIFNDPNAPQLTYIEELDASFHLRPVTAAFSMELEQAGIIGDLPKAKGKTKVEKQRLFEKTLERRKNLFNALCSGWEDWYTGTGQEIPYNDEMIDRILDLKADDGSNVGELIIQAAFTIGTEIQEEMEKN